MVERVVWQDEKDFPLDLPINAQNNRVYFKGKKCDVPDKNINKETKRLTKKVMVSAAVGVAAATVAVAAAADEAQQCPAAAA